MPSTFNGLPLHPLIVHAVVVLVPLAVVWLLVLTFVPRWRDRYAGLGALVAVVALGLVPLASDSGETLQAQIGSVGEHAELGDQLKFFVFPVAVLAVALWWFTRRARTGPALARPLALTLTVLSVVASLATGWQVYRVGDSGARAVWQHDVAQVSGVSKG